MANNTSESNGWFGCLSLILMFLYFFFLSNPGLAIALVFFCLIAFMLFRIVSTTISWVRDANSQNTSYEPRANSTTTSTTSQVPINAPDDLDNILMYLSNGEIKDPVTQEIFHPGETVYLCHRHRLAYHEDSWQEMGRKCMVCGSNVHTKTHVIARKMESNLAEKIQWRDVDTNTYSDDYQSESEQVTINISQL